MDCEIGTDVEVKRLVVAALSGQLTDEQAEGLAALDQDLLKLVLMVMAKQIAEQGGQIAEQGERIAELESTLKVAAVGDPATPSGQKPLYANPNASPVRRGATSPRIARRPNARPPRGPLPGGLPRLRRAAATLRADGPRSGRLRRR